MNRETAIQNKIRVALSGHGIVLRLNVGAFQTQDGRYITNGLPPGTSDLLFIGDGYIAFIEVKTPEGRPSKAQQRFIAAIQRMGHKAGVARSVEEALQIIGV